MLFVFAETLLCSEKEKKKLSPCSSLALLVDTFHFCGAETEVFKEKVI